MMRALSDILSGLAPLTIAVSGGVDSMTLAHVAHRRLGRAGVTIAHAVSPAVPAAATERVRAYARAYGWTLHIVDAGEFGDPRYRANPVNRCFFCKENLYATVARISRGQIASGTNLDDLSDFRPGLAAAEVHRVVHPFVLAKADKAAVYRLAKDLGLSDLAALPAQPCLASRVETGLRVEPADMAFIDRMETLLRPLVGARAALRCRVTHAGIVIETDTTGPAISARAAALCQAEARTFLGRRPYRQGAAFLRDGAA